MPAFQRLLVMAFCLALASGGANTATAASVGMVTKVQSQAQVGGAAAGVGTLVNTNDELRTGPKSRLEVTFRDKTTLTLGENARVVIDRYVFDPQESTGALALSTSAAAFRMATGQLSKMREKSITVSTPAASLGVRGTDFWWGPIEGQFGVLLVHNSRLDVRAEECREGTEAERRKCRCAVTLDEAGEGTDIDRRRGCPGAAYQWPPGKVTAALSLTGFGFALGPAIPAAAAVAVGAAIAASEASNDELPPLSPVKPASP